MMRQVRVPAPTLFAQNAARWTVAWRERRGAEPSARFVWPTVDGQRADQLIRPVLRLMTEDHCSYCDVFSVWEAGASVDHFRPKSSFVEHAFEWPNLFVACAECQKRLDRYDDRLLKPDDEDYTFDRYFIYDVESGRIEPNPQANEAEAARARITIELFKLNRVERCVLRRLEWDNRPLDIDLAKRKYRFVPPRVCVPRE